MQKIKEFKQILKYTVTGGLAFLTEYGSFLFLTFVAGVNVLVISQTVSFCLGLLVSFLGSRQFTFKDAEKIYQRNKKTQLTSYLLLAIFNLLVSNLLIHGLVDYMDIPSWIAKALTMAAVVMWNFVIFKKIIFKTV